MALMVFKIIFLVVAIIGLLVIFLAPFIILRGKNDADPRRRHRSTRARLIGVIIAGIGLLVVIILSNF